MHNLDNKGARYTAAAIGLAVSLMFLTLSALMNFRYGYSLGKTPVDGYVYGGAAAAGDAFMALSPFFFFAAWRNRSALQAVVSLAIWLVLICFAFVSAIGHASSNRLDVMSQRKVAQTSYQDAREDLKRARSELGFVPEHRPSATVRAEIAKLQINPAWIQTNECTQANGKIARAYCSQIQTLSAELGNAMQADKLTTRIETLTAKSDLVSTEHTNVTSEVDPQATTLSMLSGRDLRTVQGALTVGVVLVILLMGAFGPYISFSVLQSPPVKTEGRRWWRSKPRILDLMAVDVSNLSPTDAKVPLGAQKKPAGGVLALEAPKVSRPEPSAEARALLAAIDFPLWPPSGNKRSKDSREHLPWRFLAWLTAHGLGGDYPAEKIDSLYEEFASADHREPWMAMRVVKAELATLKRYAWSSTPRHLNQRVQWTIRPPTIDKLMELLKKHGIAKEPPPTPKPKVEASSNRILPFRLGRSA